MKTLKVHQANWTSHHLASKQIKAFISLGAEPSIAAEVPEILYIMTLTNLAEQELLTRDFNELDAALEYLNEQYGHWDLSKSGATDDGDGCSTCNAH